MELSSISDLASKLKKSELEIEDALRSGNYFAADPVNAEAQLWLAEYFGADLDAEPVITSQAAPEVVRCQTVATPSPGSYGMNNAE